MGVLLVEAKRVMGKNNDVIVMKKELQDLVKAIADDDDVEAIDRAQKMLSRFKELRLHTGHATSAAPPPPPEVFKCPLSTEVMADPVIIASGQTFDRAFIQKWLDDGNRTCPRTQQLLSHTILTPNHLIHQMIAQWCNNHAINFPQSVHPTTDVGLIQADRIHFHRLLNKMSSTLSDQEEAAREFRFLTKQIPPFRALFGESVDAIPQLLSPLCRTNCNAKFDHSKLQEDLITTVLNISIHDGNKKLVAETPTVIPLLINALRWGTIETRSNAAATIFTLSALNSNKALIGASGALKPLIDLLDEGNPLAMKDVASAIFNLCILHENKTRAVRDGAVRVIMNKLVSRVHVDELLSILAMLSTGQEAIEEIGELGGVPCLLGIIRETSCGRNKENCVAILYAICLSDRSKLNDMRKEESTSRTLSQVAENGTSRAKRKAQGILDRMNRVLNRVHTA